MLCPSQMEYITWSLYVQNSPLLLCQCSASKLILAGCHGDTFCLSDSEELALHLGRMSLRATRVRKKMQQPLLTAS